MSEQVVEISSSQTGAVVVARIETHTVEYNEQFDFYGICADEVIQRDVPRTVSVCGVNGEEFIEVVRSTKPSSGEFRVDDETGVVQFGDAHNGDVIRLTYRPDGLIIRPSYDYSQTKVKGCDYCGRAMKAGSDDCKGCGAPVMSDNQPRILIQSAPMLINGPNI